jgi:hypothetical protein
MVAMLFDARPFSTKELKALLDSAVASSHYSAKSIQFLGHAFKYSNTVNCVNLHIVGNGMAGKTTSRAALRCTLQNTNTLAWVFNRMPSRVAPISKEDRTIGLECEIIQIGEYRYIFWDYGGQRHFHFIHCPFLALTNSMYVVVVSLYDFLNGRVFENHEIESTFKYWTRVLNSVTRKDGCKNVITIIDGKELLSS